jgi:hypothetical protein
MRKMLNSVALAALAAACSLAPACRAQTGAVAEPAQPARLAQQAVLRAVAQLPAAHPLRRRYRLAIAFDDPLFPPDDNLKAAPGQPQDPALAAWLALPRAARAHDVLITPDADYFWREDGRDYSAQFIVHLGAAATAAAPQVPLLPQVLHATQPLQVLQVHATYRLGRRFELLGRTGPGYYWDLRPAPPSARAAAELAAFLAAPTAPPLEGQQR